MFPSKIKTCTQTLLIFSVLSFVNGQDRKITSQKNPGCTECHDELNVLMYVRAEGALDTVHQVWDFTTGAPTVILAVAGVNSTLDIEWMDVTPRRFKISEKPKYSFATVFDKLIEYNDTNDSGYMNTDKYIAIPLSGVSWNLTDVVQTQAEVMLKMRGALAYQKMTGTIDIGLDLIPSTDFAGQLPHLIHTANSTLLDVSLVALSTRWNASRFALRAVLASSDDSAGTMSYFMRKSLDDEHTPGVFEIVEIKSPESVRNGDGGFLQFRPVAYTEPERSVESSTFVHVSSFEKTNIHSNTLRTFFRDANVSDPLAQQMFVSFGQSADGFYKKYNYTAWSLTVGYGTPPLEGFSTFVIAIICAGLGVPLLLAAVGVACACVRRRRRGVPHERLDH